MQGILDQTLRNIEPDFRKIYDSHLPLMLAMRNLNIPLPTIFLATVEFILNKDLARVLREDQWDRDMLRRSLDEFRRWAGQIDTSRLSFLASHKIEHLVGRLAENGGGQSQDFLARIEELFQALDGLDVEFDLWKPQNIYFYLVNNHLLSDMKVRAGRGEAQAAKWVESFLRVGDRLRLKVT